MRDDLPQRNPGSSFPIPPELQCVAVTVSRDESDGVTYSRDENTMRRIVEHLARWRDGS